MNNDLNSGSSAVYVGFWVDHGTGYYLTLTNRNAALMLSFLAVAVTFAGNRSWKIFRFVLYQIIATKNNSDEQPNIFTSRLKVILRNTVTAGSTITTLIEELWDNRKPKRAYSSVDGVKKRGWSLPSSMLVSTLISVLHFVAFLAAGLLTSRVYAGRTVVSKVTDSCGKWDPPDDSGLSNSLMWQSLRRNETQDADNYVRNCYPLGVSRGILDCDRLFSRSLPYTLEHNIPCPFGDVLCSSKPNGALALDSGRISFRSLGINSPLANSLYVQRRSTCSVVPDAPFINQTYTTDDGQEIARSYIFFQDPDSETSNAFLYRNENVSASYNLRAYHLFFSREGIALPIRPQTTDHDPSVIFLRSTGVRFPVKSDDPWFSAHTPITVGSTGTQNYAMDNFLNIIACKEAVRFCSDVSQNCSAWSGLVSWVGNLTTTVQILGGPGLQKNTTEWDDLSNIFALVGLNLFYTSIPSSIQGRVGPSALQAARYLVEITQTRVEPQQWKLELEYWFAMAMARLQLDIFNTIEKPPGVNASQAVNTWNTQFPRLKQLCGRVKFHSPSHTTLSTVGMVVILSFFVSLTLVSFFDTLLGYIRMPWAQKLALEWNRFESLKLLEELEAWWAEVRISNDPLQIQVAGK